MLFLGKGRTYTRTDKIPSSRTPVGAKKWKGGRMEQLVII